MSVTLTPEQKMEVQRKLVPFGYNKPDDEIDGRFGEDSQLAMRAYQASKGRETTGLPTEEDLFDLGILQRPVKGHFNMPKISSQWLSGIVASTGFKYLLTIIATYVANKLGLEQGSVLGILTQLIAIAMGVWGMAESAKSKVVVNGTVVKVNDMTAADQKAVVEAVASTKETTPAEVLKK